MANNEFEKNLVIAVGVSTGWASALKRFLTPIENLKACIVIVQNNHAGTHLDVEKIRQFTELPVDEVVHGAYATANRIFICPIRKLVSLKDGQFVVEDTTDPTQKFASIDWFFNSLAPLKERAVGVLLSGEGIDGSGGMKTISESGGFTMVQDEASAEAPSMPGHVADMGFTDHVVKPEEMAEFLSDYVKFVLVLAKSSTIARLQEEIGAAIISICDSLLKHTGHDFKHYKTSTMVRRIQRRMLVLQIFSVEDYVGLLNTDKKERDSLFNDLLINVTSFFRDPEAFDALKKEVLIPEFKKFVEKRKYRIWVAGCSTGEEPYTLAMLAFETMAELGLKIDLQIIATDIDEEALNIARKGEYPLSVTEKISSERIEKFFQRRNGRLCVSRQLRESILFSSHNLIHDPPFSQLDLISCRNVLIYLGPHLQKKLIPVFHYALRPNGYLFLGTSEALNTHKDLFSGVNIKFRIAQRRHTAIHLPSNLLGSSDRGVYSPHFSGAPKNFEEDLHLIGQRILLDEFAPKFAIIGEESQVMSVSAGIQEYLEPSEGTFHNNILKLVLHNLRAPLRSSINEAKKQKRQIQNQSSIVKTARGLVKVGIVVQPMPQLGEHTGLYMVVFRDLGVVLEKDVESVTSPTDFAMVEELERELSRLREELDKSVQDLEASNEELKSSNEELLSMNEELQSANEELEISKEEVQRGNEILQHSNIDLENLLNSTKIATIFLDDKLNIKNFTPAMNQIYDLLPQDIGRPISSFSSKAPTMPPFYFPKDLKFDQVLETEVLMPDGKVFLRRKSAYLNSDKELIGLAVTFVDITELRQSETLFKTLANTVPQMIWSTDEKGNYVYFSQQWEDFTGLNPATIQNKGFREVIHPDDLAPTIQAWNNVQGKESSFTWEYRLRDKNGLYHWHLLRASALKDSAGRNYRWVGTCTNIEAQKKLTLDLIDSRAELIRNQERFDNVASAVELGVWYCNLPFDVLHWSETVKRHFWLAPDAHVTIDTFYAMIHPEDREPTRLAIEKSISDHSHYDTNYRTVNPATGEIKWIRAIGWTDYDGKGNPIRFDGVTLDFTKDLSSLEVLRNSEWRYSMASKAAREIIWDWNLQSQEVVWNESLHTEFGYPANLLKSDSKWWIDHLHPEDRDRVVGGIHKIIESGQTYWSDEYRFQKNDGSYAHVSDRGYVQLDGEGRGLRMIGTMNDTTEKTLYLEGMEKAIRSRDEFLSIASHELKTPLTSMVLQMQILKRKIERGLMDEAGIHKSIALFLRQSRLLTSLIDDMLDVSRMANGKMAFTFQKTSLTEIVESSMEAFSANTEEKKVEIKLSIKEDLSISADPFRLEQVIYNLLSNTMKYGLQRPVAVNVYKHDNFGVIEIKDQGMGISPDSLVRIFNLFERAVPATGISGLGLGLYISKEIVEAHHGRIEVESELGLGSTFRVFLPTEQ